MLEIPEDFGYNRGNLKKGAVKASGTIMDVSTSQATGVIRRVIPADAEVLPTLASQCECELAINEDGQALVVYTKELPDGIEWAEYDIDLALLTFVTWTGKVMGLGMKVHAPLRPHLEKAAEIMMLQSTDKSTIEACYPIILVQRFVGL